jgi:hypothetical protein
MMVLLAFLCASGAPAQGYEQPYGFQRPVAYTQPTPGPGSDEQRPQAYRVQQQQQPYQPPYQAYQPKQRPFQQPYQSFQQQPYQQQPYQQQPYQQQPYQQRPYQQRPFQQPYQSFQQQPYQQQPYQPYQQQMRPGGQPYPRYQSYPRFQMQQPQSTFEPPRIQASVTNRTPYEQQSLVYRLRVTSSADTKSITPQPPQTAAAVLRPLGDPVTTRRDNGGETEFVTDYHYLLMPLSTGRIEIPPAGVSGVSVGSGGGDGPGFEVAALEPLTLDVKPPASDVQPWLPLYDLRIDAEIRQQDHHLTAGEPINLEVTIIAVGATGAQLPSIADQLNSDEFRIYPGKTTTEGRVSADGRQLLGRRVETFTLVPQYGGWLQIPALHLDWWNVRYDRPEVAVLPMLPVDIAGPANPDAGKADGEGSGSTGSVSLLSWVPLVVAVLIAMYGWFSAAFLGSGRLPLLGKASAALKSTLGELYEPVAAFAGRISPRRHFHRMRTWTGRHLPVSWKLWFCMRALEREDDPAEWGQALQILAAKHLGVRQHAHLRHIGERIAACHPRANAQRVDHLMAELDESVYGSVPIDSFERWKREFKSQIKPSLLRIRFRCRFAAPRLRGLPGLNPQVG